MHGNARKCQHRWRQLRRRNELFQFVVFKSWRLFHSVESHVHWGRIVFWNWGSIYSWRKQVRIVLSFCLVYCIVVIWTRTVQSQIGRWRYLCLAALEGKANNNTTFTLNTASNFLRSFSAAADSWACKGITGHTNIGDDSCVGATAWWVSTLRTLCSIRDRRKISCLILQLVVSF
jgi:hypothetical protein